MNKTILGVALIIAVAILSGFYMYTGQHRYYIVPSGARAYKIDRKTGQTWFFFSGWPIRLQDKCWRKISNEETITIPEAAPSPLEADPAPAPEAAPAPESVPAAPAPEPKIWILPE